MCPCSIWSDSMGFGPPFISRKHIPDRIGHGTMLPVPGSVVHSIESQRAIDLVRKYRVPIGKSAQSCLASFCCHRIHDAMNPLK
ncbi:unnamed protein product [Dicrocoelium dendriticum]|nr:unnamed protein product [Dicrocoelium dendriticum]